MRKMRREYFNSRHSLSQIILIDLVHLLKTNFKIKLQISFIIKILLVGLFFCISSKPLFAVLKWNPEIEGLFEKLNKNLSEETRIDVYNQLGEKN